MLIPLLAESEQSSPRVIFTKRAADLKKHAGQISFPGGVRETADPDRTHTALRESHEEIGLSPDQVRILGALDDLPTITGFHIRPVVGWVQGPVTLDAQTDEVAEIFSVPLDELLSITPQPGLLPINFPGAKAFLSYPWEEHVIWGATAAILTNLLDTLRAVAGSSSEGL